MDYDPEADGVETRRLERFPEIEATYTSDPIRLPDADDNFDAVLSMGVLEHVGHAEESLDELHRVLRPAGLVYCHTLPNRFS
jgi:cyclopropane fatty-acyl-phospholipid synthase-like methyltransferase